MNGCLKFKFFAIATIIILPFQTIKAQNKCFVVVDSILSEPIPYCNISTNKGDGFITNHLGEFCIRFSKTDTLLTLAISNIAYYKKEILVMQNNSDSIIYLQPKQYKLNEIDINWSNYEFTWVGNRFKKVDYYINLWRFCQLGIYIAPLKNRDAVLETVLVPIQNPNTEKVPFRLHVYGVDSIGGVGNDLLPENIYGALMDVDNAIVELSILKYQLRIPANGLFITIELLSNNKPDELQYGKDKTPEKNNNKIGMTHGRFQHRNMIKVSAWKPNSFYIESYPFTNVPGLVGDLPMIKVKVREVKE